MNGHFAIPTVIIMMTIVSVIIQAEEAFQGRLAQRKFAVSSDGRKNIQIT